MKIVKSKKYGIIHALSFCMDSQCKWQGVDLVNCDYNMQKMRNEIKKHVRKTGHTVNLETGNSIEYFLTQNE